MKITSDNAIERKTHEFVAEASEIGIRPGHGWPKTLETTLGNGQHFVAIEIARDLNKDLCHVKYKQLFGCITLTVFND